LLDCPIESECLFSARKHYIDHPDWWSYYVWDVLQHGEVPAVAPLKHYSEWSLEEKIASLKDDNPYGRCVWKCDNDVVDHQSVVVEFADGATGTLNMIGGAARPSRMIHLVGTHGEIQGVLEESRFTVRFVDPTAATGYREQVIDLAAGGALTGTVDAHGNGDLRLVADFLRVLRGEQASISTTILEDSVYGHLIGFRADQAMSTGAVVEIASPGTVRV
jgi:hypothetical protein